MTVRAGLIGLGNIGKPMAQKLIQAAYHTTVFDVRAKAVWKRTTTGAHAATSRGSHPQERVGRAGDCTSSSESGHSGGSCKRHLRLKFPLRGPQILSSSQLERFSLDSLAT
jgi:hypothetical protein